jgi:hypothetical protein
MIIKQLSVFLENKSGRLTEVTQILGDLNINISALSIADTAEYGILRMIVTDPDKAVVALKEQGFSVSLTQVICLLTPDTPGALYKSLQILSDAGISIQYMYAFAMGEKASIVIKTDALEEAIETLQKNQLELIKASDIYKL